MVLCCRCDAAPRCGERPVTTASKAWLHRIRSSESQPGRRRRVLHGCNRTVRLPPHPAVCRRPADRHSTDVIRPRCPERCAPCSCALARPREAEDTARCICVVSAMNGDATASDAEAWRARSLRPTAWATCASIMPSNPGHQNPFNTARRGCPLKMPDSRRCRQGLKPLYFAAYRRGDPE